MSVYGGWKTATIADEATESGETDLGHDYDFSPGIEQLIEG